MTVRRNPFVFVVGCPRSGTTLLQRMLHAHPELAVANDTHFIPKVLKRCARPAQTALDRELVAATLDYHRFTRLGLEVDAVWAASEASQSYGEFVSALYDRFAAVHGKPLSGEKTPDYVRCIGLLNELFPWVKFVHIIRDGRDVALSALNWAHDGKGQGRSALWDRDPVAVCALWWRRFVERGRTAGQALGTARYREVCYERLVIRPQGELVDLCAFLDLSYSDEMLAFHRGKTRHNPGLSSKNAWLPVTPNLRNWKTQLATDDTQLFDALAGDILQDLGYAVTVPRPSDAILRRAEHCRRIWRQEYPPASPDPCPPAARVSQDV